MSEISFKLKLVLLGEGAVGKTSLVYQFVNKKFKGDYTLTVGVDFLSKNIEYEPEKHAMLSLWDIGGQKRFESIRSTFYRGASGVLLVFDLTRPPTFENIKTWHDEVKVVSGNQKLPFILIGNKADLLEDVGRVIDQEVCEAYAAENGSIYIETSAKSGENVEDSFLKLTQIIIKAQTQKAQTPQTETSKTQTPKTQTPKTETSKTETPKTETPKTETPKTKTKKRKIF